MKRKDYQKEMGVIQASRADVNRIKRRRTVNDTI